jgi:hypothetical protein
MSDRYRGGPTAWPPDFYLWGHLKSRVYGGPVDNKDVLQHRVVDACQSTQSYPDVFEWMQWSMMRCGDTCIKSHQGRFDHLL